MHRNQSVSVHQFAMTPRPDIPRSSFRMQKALKTSFDAGLLVPVMCEEVLPGDTFSMKMTAFCRLATPLFPVMDNLHMESFFFFVPNRLVWSNWVRFMGEQDDPDSSISYTVPQAVTPVGGYAIGSLGDYFGLPTVGQLGGAASVSHSALPLRMYRLIYNEWFRDENLVDSIVVATGDGPDAADPVAPYRRGKRYDYFTGCLPWPQKGGIPVQIPLGTTAPVFPTQTVPGTNDAPVWQEVSTGNTGRFVTDSGVGANPHVLWNAASHNGISVLKWQTTALYADLSAATAATINQLRQSFQIQKLLERDARGGTRYTEIVRSHFGVMSPDSRLQRPEYIGGGHSMVNINPIAQTSATSATGTDTPQGNLAAFGTATLQGHGFSQSFVEHGYVIGIVNVRADLTYQQGLRRHWSRSTRYDYYFPAFAMLGEQAVLSKEIYINGSAGDSDVFGYQERWAEYRYNPSEVTGLMRSTAAGTIDQWHYADRFATRPVLNQAFIEDSARSTVSRTTAVGEEANGQQLLGDFFFDIKAARPLPMYSVPGLIDHF